MAHSTMISGDGWLAVYRLDADGWFTQRIVAWAVVDDDGDSTVVAMISEVGEGELVAADAQEEDGGDGSDFVGFVHMDDPCPVEDYEFWCDFHATHGVHIPAAKALTDGDGTEDPDE